MSPCPGIRLEGDNAIQVSPLLMQCETHLAVNQGVVVYGMRHGSVLSSVFQHPVGHEHGA